MRWGCCFAVARTSDEELVLCIWLQSCSHGGACEHAMQGKTGECGFACSLPHGLWHNSHSSVPQEQATMQHCPSSA